MLFRKKIDRSCSYCEYATRIDEEQVLCIKKGVRSSAGKCRKFSYAPCKRVPPRPKAMDFAKYNEKDYSL